MKTKRYIALILVVVMCITSLVGCGNKQEQGQTGVDPSQANYAEHIDIIIDNNPTSVLSPFSPASASPSNFWSLIMIFDRLVTMELKDGDFVFNPALATSWDTTDYQNFTFHLRDNVKFHNGEILKASDVVWTIEQAKAGAGSQANSLWSPVDTATAVDEKTVQIKLKNVDVDFILKISQPHCAIVNEKAMKEDPEKGVYVGTGAYAVKSFVSGDTTEYVRNEDYWGELPITKSQTWRYIPEASARTIMLMNGEAQMCLRTPDEDMEMFKSDENFKVYSPITHNPNAMVFNMADPICGDYNFRMAVLHGMDKDLIALAASGENAIPDHSGTMWGYDTEFRNKELSEIEYNPQLAKEFLAKSNYKGEPVELVCALASFVRAAPEIQQELADIGINIKIKQIDNPAMGAYTMYGDNKSQIALVAITMTESASSFANAVLPGGSFNRASYNNPEVTEMLAQAATTTDTAARKQLYYDIQAKVMENPPFTNLFNRISAIVAAKGIDGVVIPATECKDFRYMTWDLNK